MIYQYTEGKKENRCTDMISLVDMDRLLSSARRIIYHFEVTLKLLDIKNFSYYIILLNMWKQILLRIQDE